MTYESASAYLLGTINEGASRGNPERLDRMRALLQALGDPQRAYPTLHVGGTSGKGSTSTMLSAALEAAGHRVGLHTKPHLASMTERMRIDGVPIPPDYFGELLADAMPALDNVASEWSRPSYYETLLALSFLYFARAQVDVAVIEVGLGGKLDGTNVLVPRTAVLTNVGLDHVEILGGTLEAIASDKAGIAKPGVPLVSDVTDPGARAVIEARCANVGAPFLAVAEHSTVEVRGGARYGQAFDVVTKRGRYELALPVLGGFQRRNAATAIVALETLSGDLRPTIADVERGLARLVIPGRMEFFPAHPPVIFDIAHNPDKAASLAAALREEFSERRFAFVVAIGESKDAVGVLDAWLDLPGSFIFTSFETTGRTATNPRKLASIASERGATARAIADPIEALSVARRSAGSGDVVVVTGSTFIVATLREWWIANVSEAPRPV